MVDLVSYFSMILIVVPIVMGVGAWATLWLKEEFYAYPLYEEEEYNHS